MSKKKTVSEEEFERAFKRLAKLYAEYNILFIQFLGIEDEKLREWVIRNHKEVESLSEIIGNYEKPHYS